MGTSDDQHPPGGGDDRGAADGRARPKGPEHPGDAPRPPRAAPPIADLDPEMTEGAPTEHLAVLGAPAEPEDDERTEIAFLSGALANLSSLADELPRVEDTPASVREETTQGNRAVAEHTGGLADEATEAIHAAPRPTEPLVEEEKAEDEGAVEMPLKADADPKDVHFYPRKRKRRASKVMDPFLPPNPREAGPAAVKLGEINEEAISEVEGGLRAAEAAPSAAPAPMRAMGQAPPAAAPASRGLPPWITFFVSYAATVAVTLGVAWFALDLSLDGGRTYAGGPTAGTLGQADLKASHEAAHPAPRAADPADRCRNDSYWSRPDVLFNRFLLKLTTGSEIEGAMALGLEDCQLKVRLPSGEERSIPLADIVSFEKL